MRILITRPTVCGGVFVDQGSVVDASDSDARVLIGLDKAVPAPSERGIVPETAVNHRPVEMAVKKRRGRRRKK